MKHIIKLTVSVLMCFSFASCAKDIVDLTGTITGSVKDYSNGQLISNCIITLSPGEVSKSSSSSGIYEFAGIEQGEYTLTFSKAGYEEQSTWVTVVSGKTVTKDVLLNPKSSFALSESNYDFGDLEVTKTFYVFNNSDEDCSFTISNVPSWLSFNKMTGTVKASGNDSFTATVDRNGVREGEYSQNITVSYSGKATGVETLTLKMRKVTLSVPTVSIAGAAENIAQNSFDISGSITATGGSQITSYGHCWNTSGNPTVNDNMTNLGTTNAIGSFKSTAENLNTYTTYYVRTYATNAQGTSYSDQIAVTTQDVYSDRWDGSKASSFAGGTGTYVDPYKIETGAQLVLMKDYPSSNFVLSNNIDLDNRSWPSIDFSGSFDGKGYSISNLKITRNEDNLGLFSTLGEGSSVKNLTIRGVDIQASSSDNVGAIAGRTSTWSYNSPVISNCTVSFTNKSKIVGKSAVGGIIGSATIYGDGIITACMINSDVSGAVILGDSLVGGIVGSMHDGSSDPSIAMEKCQVNADIQGESGIGGVIGGFSGGVYDFMRPIIQSLQYYGNISGNTSVGGIVGSCSRSLDIVGCKVDAGINVDGDEAGGICGAAGSTDGTHLRIIACYSTGTCTSSNPKGNALGGIFGRAYTHHEVYLCYSTMLSENGSFNGLIGGGDGWGPYKIAAYATDCASVLPDNSRSSLTNCDTSCSNITEFLQSCYSEYSSYYNFGDTWTWTGIVGGGQKSVSCPKLSWE